MCCIFSEHLLLTTPLDSCFCSLLNSSHVFRFSFFPCFQCLHCILYFLPCEEFLLFFLVPLTFFMILFSFLKENTLQHLREPLLTTSSSNNDSLWKSSCEYLSISNSKNPRHETFWILYWELLLMNVSKIVCGIVLVLPWSRIIDKTIKILGFHNNRYLLDLPSLDVSSRGVFRTLSNT